MTSTTASDWDFRARRSVATAATDGGSLSRTSGPPASGSATPGQHLVQVTTPAASAKPTSPPSAGSSTCVDIAVPLLVGGGDSAGASTGASVASGTTTTTAPTDLSPGDAATRTSAAASLASRQAHASQLQASPPAVAAPPSATSGATQPSVTRPPATQPVATPPGATSRVATSRVATEHVATESLKAPRRQELQPGGRSRSACSLWPSRRRRSERGVVLRTRRPRHPPEPARHHRAPSTPASATQCWR